MPIRIPNKKGVQPPTDQDGPLKELNADQRHDVDTMLIGGASSTEVIDYVRKVHKLWVHRNTKSVQRTINKYRKEELTSHVVASVMGMEKNNSVSLLKNLDTMGEMERLIEIQQARFLKMYEKEKAGPLLMEVVTREAMNLKTMLAELARLQLETGTIRRAPRIIHGTTTDEHGNIRSFDWTEEQTQLFKVLEHVVHGDQQPN